MIGINIHKTVSNDFEKIYPLLLDFNSPFTRDDWQRIFNYRWEGTQDHVGYHLEKNGEIVGFMGLIFSCRYKNNNCYQFCNITSLIVRPEYRAVTLLLLRKLTTYQDTIFTGLGPIPESFRLMTKLGFLPFEDECKIIPVINGLFSKKKSISFDLTECLVGKLDVENKRILLDHANLKCKFILFEYKNANSLFIYTTGTQKHYGLCVTKIHLHYVSNLKFFHENMRAVLNIFRVHFGLCAAIYVDKRLVADNHYILSLGKKINSPKIRSKLHLNEIDIDALYSEAVLL